MRRKRVLVALALLAGITLVMFARIPGSRRLVPEFFPHPDGRFQKGQCTWYVYQRTQDAGWKLRFDRPYGRHGRAWWERVTNAVRGQEPRVHTIMVLDGWPGNEYGHVAFVERVESRDRWTVSHANLHVQTPLAVREGEPIYEATFERVPGGVRLVNTRACFRLRGFLYPPRDSVSPRHTAFSMLARLALE